MDWVGPRPHAPRVDVRRGLKTSSAPTPGLLDLPADVLARITHGTMTPHEAKSLWMVSRDMRAHMDAHEVFARPLRPQTMRQLESAIARFPKLTALDLSLFNKGARVCKPVSASELAACVRALPHLAYLEGVPPTPEHVAALEGAALRRLAFGKAGGYRTDDVPLEALRGMPLEELDLGGCLVGDAGLRALSGKRLHTLSFAYSHRLGDDGLRALEDMPLRDLRMTRTDPFDLPPIVRSGTGTRMPQARLPSTSDVFPTGTGLRSVCRPSLTRLHLACYPGLGDAALAPMTAAERLEDLTLEACDGLTGRGLGYVRAPRLRALRLDRCRDLDGENLKYLRAPMLEELSLQKCPRVSDAAIAALERFPLKNLNLWNAEGITREGVDAAIAAGVRVDSRFLIEVRGA